MNPIDRFECSECGKVYDRWANAADCCGHKAAKDADEDREPVTDEDRQESQKQIDLYKARRGLME